MKEHIDPITIEKLQEFNTRRKKLLGMRGLCTLMVTAISIFSILATIDLYVLLPDGIRSFLTYSGWIIVISLVWFTSIGKLLQKPTRRDLAKYIEQQDPQYREDLLSAIELGVERFDPKNDSPVFRKLLQEDVAGRIKGLDVKNTLPIRLIGNWIKASAFLVILLFGLLLTPDFGKGFSTALGRTMLGANLARVSDIQIALLSPDPDTTHPEGETIRIKAALQGEKEDLRAVKKVILETANSGKDIHRTTMQTENDGNFHARLNILTADTKFRIQAGLAQSQWFDLDTAPRPKIETFDITYTPPAYSQLPQTSRKQTTKGDLQGMENTAVTLKLQANQPISKAELRLDLSTTPANRTIPLEVSKDDPTILQTTEGSLRLVAPGTYRIHLEARDTGFDNKYSPKYEISVYPDQAPSLELLQPARNLLVQSDELLAVHAQADDDLPIQRLELQLRTNNGRWVPTKLAEAQEEDTSTLHVLEPSLTTVNYQDASRNVTESGHPSNAITLNHTLDLLHYTLSPGDRVKLKLVAYDLKRQRTETQPIELTILSRNFETSRIESVAAQARIHKILVSLSESVGKIGKESDEHSKHLKTLNPQDPQSSIQWASFADLSKQIHDDVLHASEEITVVARTLPKGTAAREASYALRTLGKILHEVNTSPPAYIESSRESIDRNESNRFLDDARNRYGESRGRIFSLENQFRSITAGNFRAIVAEDLHNLVKQQHDILPADQTIQDEPLFWKRLARREKSALNQAVTIERNIERLGNALIGRDYTNFKKYSHELAQTRKELEKALEVADATQPGPELLAPAKAFKAELVQFLEKAGSQHHSLYSKAVKEHRNITVQTEDEFHSIYRTLYHSRDTYNNRNQELQQRQNGNTRQANIHAAKARHFGRLLSQSTWPGAVGRLKAAAAATETRKDADNQYAKDAGMAALALDNLASQYSTQYSMQGGEPEAISRKLDQFARAFRKLENIHQLVDVQTQVQTLAHSEKWQLRHPAALIHSPYEWVSAHRFLPEIAKKFRESQFSTVAVRELTQLPHKDYSKAIKAEMDNRLKSARIPTFRPSRQTENLNRLLADIAEILQLVAPEAKEARELIQSLTPTIAELARELAAKTEQLSQETQEHAKDAEQTQDPETKRAELQELQDKQESLMAELQDLTNALRQDANTQDILTEEGRERARDADDSIAMLTEPANEAQQNLQQANLAQRTEDQVRELNETTESQETLLQALDQVAEHYENLELPENSEALAQSRQELRAAEEELGIAQELEDQYSQVERLAELAQLDPEQLLAALESELDQNRLMQTQLSDIAEDTLLETQENLETAAQEEAQIPDELAQSDTETKNEARNLAQQLRQIGQEARKISREEVNQANQAARKAQDASTADQLEQAKRELDQLGSEAENAARSSNPRDIAETAQELIEPLQQIAEQLEEASADASTLQQTNKQNARQKAEELAKKAEELTQQANDAAKEANALTEKANAAREDAIQAQQDLLTANDQGTDTPTSPTNDPNQTSQSNSQENPSEPSTSPDNNPAQDSPQANNNANAPSTEPTGGQDTPYSDPGNNNQATPPLTPDQAEEKFNEAVAQAQAAQQEAKAAQSEANELREQANQANREAKAAENLANQFEKNQGKANEILNQAKQAQQKADTASDKTENLANRAKELAEQLAEALADISPSESALDQANAQQEDINNTAQNAAEDLARAARHEERLGNQDIAQELENLAENTAQALDQPIDSANEQLLSLDAQNQLSDLAQAAQEIANDEAANAENSAQKAKQDQLGQDIAQSAQELEQAAQQAQQASQQDAQQQSELAKAAEKLAQELAQAAQEFAQQSQQAQQASQEIQQPSQQASQQAQQAQEAAQTAQQAAQQAQEAVQQAQQANQQAQQAQQAAQQAQQTAQQAQQAAQKAADNAAQDPAAAEQTQAAAEQASQAAQQAQTEAQQAQQQAQQASAQAAQQSKQAAQAAQQAAQQAKEAQLASQPSQPAPKSAREAQQAANAAQQAADAAQDSAQQAAESAQQNEGNPISQEAAEIAAQAASNAQQAAQQAADASQQAQEANSAGSPESRAEAQAAANDAQAAAQLAQQSAAQAAAAAELAAAPDTPQLHLAEQACQQAQQAAQQAQQSAQQAQQSAQGQQNRAQPQTNAANSAAEQAQAAAEQASALAQQAGELAQGLDSGQPANDTPFDQPFADASQALAQQAQNLEEFFNEGLAQAPTPAQAASASPAPASPASPASPSPASPASPAQAAPASPSSPSPASPAAPAAPAASPFTNPETSQALAQTLDAVDQAVADAQAAANSPEAAAGAPAEAAPGAPSESGQLSDAASAQAAGQPAPGAPAPGAPTPGAPAPGSPGAPSPGQPSPGALAPGSPQPGAPGSPSQSLAQAAQALAQAAAAQAAAMSQARNASQMPGQNPIGQGLQLNSETGAAITAGPLAYQKLEEANRKSDLDWGKLPSQMAKDLMEGSQEDISGEYRQQVQTYFRAIAELARQNKDEK